MYNMTTLTDRPKSYDNLTRIAVTVEGTATITIEITVTTAAIITNDSSPMINLCII